MDRVFFRIICAAIIIASIISVSAAQSFLNLRVGTLNPKDTKSGLIFGLMSGRQVDERLDFGLSADLFIRKFTKESTVNEEQGGQANVTEVQKEIDYSLWALPIMVQLNLHLIPGAVVEPYLGIAGGYEMVFSREANYQTDEKDSRFYHGFGWQLIGGGAYAIGASSAVTGEIFYNGSTVKRSKGKDDLGFPIHEEVNFSGLGFRIGLRFGWI